MINAMWLQGPETPNLAFDQDSAFNHDLALLQPVEHECSPGSNQDALQLTIILALDWFILGAMSGSTKHL